MNEEFGPAADILFDIGHRRHPVRYTTANLNEENTRRNVVSKLASSLAAALRPTIQLGPRSAGTDSEKQFELESNSIRRHWESKKEDRTGPFIFFSFHPTRHFGRRWPTAGGLEAALRKHEVPGLDGRHFYPPTTRYTARTQWGLFNAAYGAPDWALCYSGQFWAAIDIAARYDHKPTLGGRVVYSLDQQDRVDPPIKGGTWVNYPYVRLDIINAYRFAASFASAFAPHEELAWRATAVGLNDVILSSTEDNFFSVSQKCQSPYAEVADVDSAESFAGKWIDYCLDFMEELFGMFEIDGDYLDRATHKAYLDQALRHVNRR